MSCMKDYEIGRRRYLEERNIHEHEATQNKHSKVSFNFMQNLRKTYFQDIKILKGNYHKISSLCSMCHLKVSRFHQPNTSK